MNDSYIPLSKKEEYLLDECSKHICYAAYMKLKRVMDWETCIAGESREICYQWLREALYKPKRQGKRAVSITRDEARYIVEQLEAVGLVTRLSKIHERQLILKLNYAYGKDPSKISGPTCSREVAQPNKEKWPIGEQPETNDKTESCDDYNEKCPRADEGSFREVSQEVAQTSITISKTNLNNINNVELNESFLVDNSHEEIEQKPHAQLNAQPSTQKQRKSNPDAEVITRIFEHWKTTMNHPRAKLDDKRKRDIRKGLKLNFTEDELKQAITGCSKSAFHMGQNDRNEVYDGLGLIFRNADKIENFIAQADKLVLSHLATGDMKHGLQRTESNYERIMRQGVEFYERNEPLF